jgi:hypothetical protein
MQLAVAAVNHMLAQVLLALQEEVQQVALQRGRVLLVVLGLLVKGLLAETVLQMLQLTD